MNTIPTAKEFLLDQHINSGIENAMIGFAGLHVNKALLEANKEVFHIINTSCYYESQGYSRAKLIETSIFDAYSLDNIK